MYKIIFFSDIENLSQIDKIKRGEKEISLLTNNVRTQEEIKLYIADIFLDRNIYTLSQREGKQMESSALNKEVQETNEYIRNI